MTCPQNVHEVIEQMIVLLQDPKSWIKFRRWGVRPQPNDPRFKDVPLHSAYRRNFDRAERVTPDCFCLVGAAEHIMLRSDWSTLGPEGDPNVLFMETVQTLANMVGTNGQWGTLPQFNDSPHTDHDAVMGLLRDAEKATR